VDPVETGGGGNGDPLLGSDRQGQQTCLGLHRLRGLSSGHRDPSTGSGMAERFGVGVASAR